MINTQDPEFHSQSIVSAVPLACETGADRDGRSSPDQDDRSPVTVADFAAQALVAYLLYKEFRKTC